MQLWRSRENSPGYVEPSGRFLTDRWGHGYSGGDIGPQQEDDSKKGVKYPAKIYGYTENTSVKVNNTYMMDTIVHYFDSYHVEREAIIPTGFTRGAGMYPIGLTIDIFEYNGKYGYDPDSVRDERLPGEEELMDDKPVAPDKLRLVAVRCPNCGSSFRAATGYSSKCPYCGNYLNVNM